MIPALLTVDVTCLCDTSQQCLQPPLPPTHVEDPPTSSPWLEAIVTLVGLLAGLAQEETLTFTGSLSLLPALQLNVVFKVRNFVSRESQGRIHADARKDNNKDKQQPKGLALGH